MQYINSSSTLSDNSIIKVEQLANVDPNGREDGSILVFNAETGTWEISETLGLVLDGNNRTIRIRRGITPSYLSLGELLYDESQNTLYYGSSNGIIAIAGSGKFVTTDSSQNISGPKTFIGTIKVKTPIEDTNPTTKLYVDTAISNISLNGLRDINISDLSDGSVLVYNSQISKWKVDQTTLNLTDGGNF